MRYFLCFILPPLAVITTGRLATFILSIILTLCFWIPGVIHALFVVNRYYEDQRHEELLKVMSKK